MSFRFIEFCGDFYLVVGINYNPNFDPPECYVAVALLSGASIYTSLLSPFTIEIPFDHATEITDKKKINTLLILYGT